MNFPHASKDFLRLNDLPPYTQPQRPILHEPVEKKKREGRNPTRCIIRIKSFRRRLLDPDNPCPKFFIDAFKYAGAIPDDRFEDIILQISQKKVRSKKEEKTVIELTYP